MNDLAKDYYHRIYDGVKDRSAFGRLSFWLEKNTTIYDKPFSFDGHEFQREIIDSVHPSQNVMKPSQVGMSECTARLTLAFLAVTRNMTGIYTLPTMGEAQKFSKSRLDPIIEGSKTLTNLMVSGSDSSMLKRIGTSHLHMAGTFGKALISIPASLLVNDEYDFSDPENLKTAESRLSHSPIYDEDLDIRGIRRRFSTPTLPGIGIDKEYKKSDQRKRLCKCKHCKKWVNPSFFDIVFKGYDVNLKEVSAVELETLDTKGIIDTAILLCPSCHNPLTRANLQPEYRQWVAEFPNVRAQEGWQVNPLDLPNYHTPVSLVRKRISYGDEIGHFYNFTLGLTYADASNSVLETAVKVNTILSTMFPDSANTAGCIAGLDVGKTSWLTVGKLMRIGDEEHIHIFWKEQIHVKQYGEADLVTTVYKRVQQFKIVKLCVDSMPYTSDMLRLQSMLAEGQCLLVSYTLQDKKLPDFVVDDKKWEISANRTKCFNNLVKKVNTGLIKYDDHPETIILEKHLQGMKRVDRLLENGDVESNWEKVGPDHYMHSLGYLNMAASMVQAGIYTGFSVPFTVREAIVGKKADD